MAKSNNRLFLAHALVYGAGTVLLQAASIVLLPLYTHYLTPADFGALEILSRTGQVFGIFLMANGIVTATFAFYCQAKTPEERERTAATVTTFLGIVLLGGGMAVVAVAGPLGSLIGVESSTLAAAGILVSFFDCATVIPMCLAQARTESVYYVCVSLAMFVCRVTIITIAVAGLGWGMWGVLWASIATSTLFGVILNLREFWGKTFRPDMTRMREMVRFALPFVPGGLCFFVLTSGDRFFLVRCAGAEELGIYALGCKLAMAVGMFGFTPFFKVWSARMYDAFASPNAAEVVGRAVTRMLAAYVFAGLTLCLFVDDVVGILATPAYARATEVVGLVVLSGFFSTAATLMDGAFYAQRRTALKPWIIFASMVVMCGLYAGLIPRFGAMGAAAAALGGLAFHAVATWFVSQRVFHVQYEYGRVAGMLASAVALVLLAGHLDLGIANIPAKLALCVVWFALLWVAELVSKDEKAMIAAGCRQVLRRLGGPFAYARVEPEAPLAQPEESSSTGPASSLPTPPRRWRCCG